MNKDELKRRFQESKLYCFSPGNLCGNRDPLEIVEKELKGGADVIQLREKHRPKKEIIEIGFYIKALTSKYNALFIVNDDLDVALILDADGLHLGQEDIPIEYARSFMKDKLIGISTHSLEQAKDAIKRGADYIGFGPIFETSTKEKKEKVVGLEALRKLSSFCPIPYVAIGGIGLNNINTVLSYGCKRVAIISDIINSPDIEKRCKQIKEILSQKE
jgi:thiamine-phosphate pyrophosphorylase